MIVNVENGRRGDGIGDVEGGFGSMVQGVGIEICRHRGDWHSEDVNRGFTMEMALGSGVEGASRCIIDSYRDLLEDL